MLRSEAARDLSSPMWGLSLHTESLNALYLSTVEIPATLFILGGKGKQPPDNVGFSV